MSPQHPPCAQPQTQPTSLDLDNRRLAQSIDHTKLTFSPNENEAQAIQQLCQEAKTYHFYAVCVRPRHIALAKQRLQGSAVQVATVIGFPMAKVRLADELKHATVGLMPVYDKVKETKQAIQAGADELDLVINVSHVQKDTQTGSQNLLEELRAIQAVAQGIPIKVIIETDLLTPQAMLYATEACAQTGMAMVKTSTGMVTDGQGATLEAVHRIAARLKNLNAPTGIKASGGIKNRTQALAFLEAGVKRLGTSAGVAIIQDEAVAPEAY